MNAPAAALRRRLIANAALVAITVLAFLPTLRAGFIWDDSRYIEANSNLRSIQGLWRIWTDIGATPQYYPVTHTSFWIEYHLWGLNPFGYHLDNLLLHAISALLLYEVLRGLKISGAWAIAAIWAIHPLQVESVAWATERKNVLSGVLFLLAARIYLKWIGLTTSHLVGSALRTDSPAPSETVRSADPTKASSHLRCYFLALTLFILALLSKSVTSSFPAVILVLIWWERGRIAHREILPLIPFFALGVAMSCVTGWMEKHVVGAVGSDFNFTFLQRCAIAGRAVWFYAIKLLWPDRLIFSYPRWDMNLHGRRWLLLFPLTVLFALIALLLLRRRSRGPFAAVVLFIGMLTPALGFVNVYPMRFSFVADHFQYLAGIAFIALVVACIAKSVPPTVGAIFASIAIALLALCTWQRCHVFENRELLWTDTLKKNPNSWLAHSNYAEVLSGRGDSKGARDEYLSAIRLNPRDYSSLNDLGLISESAGDDAQAIDWFKRAIDAIDPSEPPETLRHRAVAWFNLGALYQQRAGNNLNSPDINSAIGCYKKAVECASDYAPPVGNLGIIYLEQNRIDDAIRLYSDAIAANPDNARAHNDLGSIYANLRRWDEAITEFKAALGADPNYELARQHLEAAERAKPPAM